MTTRLPNVTKAKLPVAYVEARAALAKCEKIDECKDWADRSAAMASYAKQAHDDTLRKLSMRIQARAIRRCGELLKEVIPSKGGEPHKKKHSSTGSGAGPSRKAVATAAGLSKRQQRDALRVASVPEEDFERQVESDDPPSVTQLAEQGKREPAWMEEIRRVGSLPGYKDATRVLGLSHTLGKLVDSIDPKLAVSAMGKEEGRDLLRQVRSWLRWLQLLERYLKEGRTRESVHAQGSRQGDRGARRSHSRKQRRKR